MKRKTTTTRDLETPSVAPSPKNLEEVDTHDTFLKSYTSGAKRCTDADLVRFDLICPTALNRLARIYAEGARKYGVFNWTRGMPIGETLNHAHRHLNIAALGGDSEGPPSLHLTKAVWNIFAVIHFIEKCPHHNVAEFLEEMPKQ